jgi:hypothetical protein
LIFGAPGKGEPCQIRFPAKGIESSCKIESPGPAAAVDGHTGQVIFRAVPEAADSVFLRAIPNLIMPLSVASLTAADQTIFRVGLID